MSTPSATPSGTLLNDTQVDYQAASQARDFAYGLTVAIGAAIAIVGYIVFLFLRPKFPKVFHYRSYEHKFGFTHWQNEEKPEEPGKGLFDFISVLKDWFDDDRIFEQRGLDVVAYLKFLRCCLEIFILYIPFAGMLWGVDGTGENHKLSIYDPNYVEGLSGISISALKQGSPRLWAHWVASLAATVIVCWRLFVNRNVMKKYFIKELSMNKPEHFAIMVREIKEKTDEELKERYEKIYPGKVREAHIVQKCEKEWKKELGELNRMISGLEKAEWAKENKPEKGPPKHKENKKLMFFGGEEVESIPFYTENIPKKREIVNREIKDRNLVKPCNVGFVVFNNISTAQQAVAQNHGDGLPPMSFFFINYITVLCFLTYTMKLLRPAKIIVPIILKKLGLAKTERDFLKVESPGFFPYHKLAPKELLVFQLAVTYLPISSYITIPAACFFFVVSFVSFYNFVFVHPPAFRGKGIIFVSMWNRMLVSTIIGQVTLFALLSGKESGAAALMIINIFILLAFWMFCARFFGAAEAMGDIHEVEANMAPEYGESGVHESYLYIQPELRKEEYRALYDQLPYKGIETEMN